MTSYNPECVRKNVEEMDESLRQKIKTITSIFGEIDSPIIEILRRSTPETVDKLSSNEEDESEDSSLDLDNDDPTWIPSDECDYNSFSCEETEYDSDDCVKTVKSDSDSDDDIKTVSLDDEVKTQDEPIEQALKRYISSVINGTELAESTATRWPSLLLLQPLHDDEVLVPEELEQLIAEKTAEIIMKEMFSAQQMFMAKPLSHEEEILKNKFKKIMNIFEWQLEKLKKLPTRHVLNFAKK